MPLLWFFSSIFWKRVGNDSIKSLDLPISLGWQGVVLVFSIIKIRQISCIISLFKLEPWSAWITSGAPDIMIHSTIMAFATVAFVMSCSATVTAYFVSKSLIIRTYLALDFLANVTGPKKSGAIVLKAPWTEKVCNSAFRLIPAVEPAAQRSQLAICFSTLVLSDGHQNLCFILARVFSTPKCPPLFGELCNWYKISFLISLGIIACQPSFTRLLGFHFLYKTPLDVVRSSQLLQSSSASRFPQDRASSMEIGFIPKVQCESSKFTPYRWSTQIMILIAESARCRFPSSLSDQVHEIRSLIISVITIPSGVTTAQWFRLLGVFSRELVGIGWKSRRFREYIQLRCSKHLEKSTRDN